MSVSRSTVSLIESLYAKTGKTSAVESQSEMTMIIDGVGEHDFYLAYSAVCICLVKWFVLWLQRKIAY